MSEIVTANDLMVSTSLGGTGSGSIQILMPRPMSADEALRCAAWLVALAEPFAEHEFSDVFKAVCST